jgi:hypothetical protein
MLLLKARQSEKHCDFNSSLRYFDGPSKMALEIDGLNYRGKGNIKDTNFLLLSLLNIKELSFAQMALND